MYYLHRRYTTQPQNKILQTKKFSLKKCSYLDPIKTSRKQCNCLIRAILQSAYGAPIPVFLLIKTMFFRLIFSIYYLLTLLPSAHIIAGWLLRYTPHRLYCLSAQATLTCPEHGFIFEG